VRFIAPSAARNMGDWSELAGPFANLSQAEAYVEAPPTDLGPVDAVTIERRDDGWHVLSLNAE
jgi:hypothetical protein